MARYPTGISGLDDELDGGIMPGSLVAIETDTTGQGDSMLRHLAAQQPTIYISTTRGKETAEMWLHDHQLLFDMTHVHIEYAGGDDKLGSIGSYLEGLEKPMNIMLDPVNRLAQRDEEEYLKTLHVLKSYLSQYRRIGYLHVQTTPRDDAETIAQNLAAIYRTADMVWKLSGSPRQSNITELQITKHRAHQTPEQAIKLRIGAEITVDPSRGISI